MHILRVSIPDTKEVTRNIIDSGAFRECSTRVKLLPGVVSKLHFKERMEDGRPARDGVILCISTFRRSSIFM